MAPAIVERLRALRDGAAACRRLLEDGLWWVRTCPCCGAVLMKRDPQEKVVCTCGWTWD